MKKNKCCFDFLLVGLSREYDNPLWLFDYVSSYSLYLGKLESKEESETYTRFDLEHDSWEILGFKRKDYEYYPYFSKEWANYEPIPTKIFELY